MVLAGILAAGSPALAGCSVTAGDVGIVPACDQEGGAPAQSVVLMAQAVPTTPVLPCVRLMPTGWAFADLDVRNGYAMFTLASDRDGRRAVTVVLTTTCDVTGATRVPSDQPGLTRYERVTRVTEGYRGARYYVAAGGCVTYQFDLQGVSRAAPVTEAALALDFVTRDAVREKVRRDSGGRLELDPPTGDDR